MLYRIGDEVSDRLGEPELLSGHNESLRARM
jgi:hypothetical protein